MSSITPVILCGGSGTRLWPLSRECHPKQFVDLGGGRTLFGETVKRLDVLEGCKRPVCVCNDKYRFYVEGQIHEGLIILEPCARNTAPALTLAALAILEQNDNSLMLVLPSDHHFDNAHGFAQALKQAQKVAEADFITVFGIRPTEPVTGYGYIKAGKPIAENCFHVEAFVEKPNLEKAQAMLDSGNYFWNAGIFLLKPQLYLEALKSHAPEILNKCQKAYENGKLQKRLFRPDREAFTDCPANSIDYAVMEHTDRAAVIPLNTGWSDLGSWAAFYDMADKDEAGNALVGRVLANETANSYLHSSGRMIAAIGVNNMAIVETADAVLVANLDATQDVRQIVEKLKADNADEFKDHRLVHKPWGTYEILSTAPHFQVKRIIVYPNESISLQMHYHRAEHWIVVSGTAEITNGNRVELYTENQSTYIPAGIVHKLHNPGKIPLEIIEIQSGHYFGEDDIVRLEDQYNREKGE